MDIFLDIGFYNTLSENYLNHYLQKLYCNVPFGTTGK